MEKTERKQLLTVSVAQETVEPERRIADAEFEGNRSLATRRLIKVGATAMRPREEYGRDGARA